MSYRLYLADGESLVHELALAAIQCRRRLGASTWATLEVPTWSQALIDLLDTWIEGEVVVMADEAEFIRAVLTEYRTTVTPEAGTVALIGRVQNPTYSAQSRVLSGVSHRAETDGRHWVQCAVDALLRPNDTVDDGGSSWVVGSAFYRIWADGASMELEELASG